MLGLPVDLTRPGPCLSTPKGPRRPRILDLYCGRGGAAVGYYAAGFDVVGVDIEPQPLYPFTFIQADAVTYAWEHGAEYDAAHASCPCQRYGRVAPLTRGSYPRLIGCTREALIASGRPYVIENVEGARSALRSPVTLCMAVWARRLYRHRLFEAGGFKLLAPPHPPHLWPQAKMGRTPGPREMHQAVGNFPAVAEVRRQMEMPWSDRRGIAESIPPVFTDYVGRQLLGALIDNQNAASLEEMTWH